MLTPTQARKTYQLVNKDNWETVDELDSFCYVFDTLPPRIRLAVDLRIQGKTVKQIAALMKITEREVNSKLLDAKKRFLRGENIG